MSAMIQIRNVPDELHRKLKSRAALEGKSLPDYLLVTISQMAEVPTLEEWQARPVTRAPMDLTAKSVEMLRAERDSR